MTMPQPLSPSPTRPWWKRWWGIMYLALLGLSVAGMLVLAVRPPTPPGPDAGPGKAVMLMIPVGALDVLLAIPIAVGIFRRRFWRLHTAPAANLLLGVVLFVLSTAAVVVFFFACLGVSDR